MQALNVNYRSQQQTGSTSSLMANDTGQRNHLERSPHVNHRERATHSAKAPIEVLHSRELMS